MFKINEKEKTVVYSEFWDINQVKYIFETSGIYDATLSDADFWEILKIAADTADFWDKPLTEDIIRDEIGEYLSENYPEN